MKPFSQKSKNYRDKILVTAIGSFSAEHVITVLKNGGNFVAGCDIYPEEWVANSRLTDCFRRAPLCSDEENYVQFLLNYCKDLGISYIIPLIDPEVDLLSRLADKFDAEGITVCAPSAACVDSMRNKLSFGETASKAAENRSDIHIIPTYSFENAPKDLSFPAVIKPKCGRSSIGKRILQSRAEYDALKSSGGFSDYIIQPFIEGSIVTVDALRDFSGNTVFSSRRELLRTVSGAGITVETIPFCNAEPFCAALLEQFGTVGCVNIEFIENISSDGSVNYYVLEINPRFSGGIEFSYMSGYDFVSEYFKIFRAKREGCGYIAASKKAPCAGKIIARSYKAFDMTKS